MRSQESEDVKLLFIQEELSQHGEWLADLLAEIIDRKRLRKSGELHDSINYSAFTENDAPGLRFSFKSYGRAIDIQGYKQNRHRVDAKSIAWGEKQNRMKRGDKSLRWYASNMYAGYYRLVSRLMYGLSDREIERLKGILEERKNNNV